MEELGGNEKGLVGGGVENEEEERLMRGVEVLDFDVLCSTVAMQSQGKWRLLENEEDGGDGVGEFNGGVLRLWEGEVLDCFDDRRIAIESFCCPCYRFGKNIRRAGLGSCFLQGTVYFLLIVAAFFNCVAFIVTKRRCFLYLGVACILFVGTYLGFFRSQIKKKFNIEGSDNSMDDCVYHLVCPCCAMCQESRTLEMNNVQGGTWHGRGDTLCVGTFGEGAKALVDLNPPSPVSIQFEPKSMPGKEGDDSNDSC